MAQANDWKDSRVMYDESTNSYRADHDSSGLLNTNVVLSIAAIKGVRPMQFPPLARTTDPNALETVLGCSEDAILSSSYVGYRVTLDALDFVEMVPIGDSQPLQ